MAPHQEMRRRGRGQDGRKEGTASGGCPSPSMQACIFGTPVEEGEEGVLLECTNKACPHRDVPIHLACFEHYQEALIKILENKGSARGWTDAQRRSNLWQKKGLAMIGMHCKCPCGKGNTFPPEEIVNAERTVLAPEGERKRKGAKPNKRKDLPTIRVTGNPQQARLAAAIAREEREKERGEAQQSLSDATIDSEPKGRPRLQSTDSGTSTLASATSDGTAAAEYPPRERRRPRGGRGRRGSEKSRRGGEAKRAKKEQKPQEEKVQVEYVKLEPAREAPKQLISYAATIKRSGTPISAMVEVNAKPSTAAEPPLASLPTAVASDHDWEAVYHSPRTTSSASSDCSGGSLSSLDAPPSLLPSPAPSTVLTPAAALATPLMEEWEQNVIARNAAAVGALPEYSLFSGRGFFLGELLFAWKQLPVH